MVAKAMGRPPKVNARIMMKLADAIQHNATIGEACRYVRISRQTYYHYFNNEPVFERTMNEAKRNQDKVVMSFLTIW